MNISPNEDLKLKRTQISPQSGLPNRKKPGRPMRPILGSINSTYHTREQFLTDEWTPICQILCAFNLYLTKKRCFLLGCSITVPKLVQCCISRDSWGDIPPTHNSNSTKKTASPWDLPWDKNEKKTARGYICKRERVNRYSYKIYKRNPFR